MKLTFQSIKKLLKSTNIKFCSSRGDFKGRTFTDNDGKIHDIKYEFECKKCKARFYSSLPTSTTNISCPFCKRSISKGEENLYKWLKYEYTGKIISRTRDIIKPYELDIFLPELNLGIEFNGIYWHKIREKEDPGHHKRKAKLCKESDIKLINISDLEWAKKQDKCKEKVLKIINERQCQ